MEQHPVLRLAHFDEAGLVRPGLKAAPPLFTSRPELQRRALAAVHSGGAWLAVPSLCGMSTLTSPLSRHLCTAHGTRARLQLFLPRGHRAAGGRRAGAGGCVPRQAAAGSRPPAPGRAHWCAAPCERRAADTAAQGLCSRRSHAAARGAPQVGFRASRPGTTTPRRAAPTPRLGCCSGCA